MGLVRIDKKNDVMYVKMGTVKYSREAPHDSELVLNYNDDVCIGLQLIGYSRLSPSEWLEHPDRALIPENILKYVDHFYGIKEGSSLSSQRE